MGDIFKSLFQHGHQFSAPLKKRERIVFRRGLVTIPRLAPGTCRNCGSQVDPGNHISRRGHINLFKADFCTQIAKLMPGVGHEKVAQIRFLPTHPTSHPQKESDTRPALAPATEPSADGCRHNDPVRAPFHACNDVVGKNSVLAASVLAIDGQMDLGTCEGPSPQRDVVLRGNEKGGDGLRLLTIHANVSSLHESAVRREAGDGNAKADGTVRSDLGSVIADATFGKVSQADPPQRYVCDLPLEIPGSALRIEQGKFGLERRGAGQRWVPCGEGVQRLPVHLQDSLFQEDLVHLPGKKRCLEPHLCQFIANPLRGPGVTRIGCAVYPHIDVPHDVGVQNRTLHRVGGRGASGGTPDGAAVTGSKQEEAHHSRCDPKGGCLLHPDAAKKPGEKRLSTRRIARQPRPYSPAQDLTGCAIRLGPVQAPFDPG